MPVDNSYNRINNAFERAVKKLQDNLQYLADNDKVGRKFITSHNLILKALIDYQQKTEGYISMLEMENMQLIIGRMKELDKLEDEKESLEAICIIHGIMDFPAWMNKGKGYLVHEAVYRYRENMIMLPCELKDWIDKLPGPEREALYKILYKNF